jgi:hypothetical protein
VGRNVKLCVLFAVVLMVVSCGDHLSRALGPETQITIVCGESDWLAYKPAFDATFGRYVYTPQKERVLMVSRIDPVDFDFYRRYRNVIVIGALEGEEEATPIVQAVLDSTAEAAVRDRGEWLFVRDDLWADGQRVMVITSTKRELIVFHMAAEAPRLFRLVNSEVNRRMRGWLYEKGGRRKTAERLAEEYDWSVYTPDYYAADYTHADDRFVSFAKSYPFRWLFVYWEPLPERPPDDSAYAASLEGWALSKRDSLTELHYFGDHLTPGYAFAEPDTFAGYPAVRIEGLWENDSLLIGGPFVTWAFDEDEQGRRYLVDGQVFAAGKKKMPFLREVEIVARTFTAGDVAVPPTDD